MEPKDNQEAGAQVPDNSKFEALDTSGFEGTADRLEQLMKSMEVLLSDVEQLRSHCSHQTTELMNVATQLRTQQDELKESYLDLSREMQEIINTVDDLFCTKSAFEAKEKQTQKLNRQLWGKQKLCDGPGKPKLLGEGVVLELDVWVKIWMWSEMLWFWNNSLIRFLNGIM